MADQSTQLQSIASKLEDSYRALRAASGSIAGLLQIGKATCAEVRAYNLWALAIYNTQAGMLAALKAGGEPNVPSVPTYPILFAWRGVAGEAALNITCTDSNAMAGLKGLMGTVLRGPSTTEAYLSANEIQIVTQGQQTYASAQPTFNSLLEMQQATQQLNGSRGGLGVAWAIVILVASIAVAVSVAIAAIMHYLEVANVQEANTAQVREQSIAYQQYVAARLDCYKTCAPTDAACVDRCKALVKEPKITLPGQTTKWGWLQWTGFVAVVGIGGFVAIRAWENHRGGSVLPDYG